MLTHTHRHTNTGEYSIYSFFLKNRNYKYESPTCSSSSEFTRISKFSFNSVYRLEESLSNPSNYRPISISSIISKIFESLIKKQIVHYFLISPDQSAYLCGRSPQPALHLVIDYLSNNVDKGFIDAISTLDIG